MAVSEDLNTGYSDRRFFFLCVVLGIFGIMVLRNLGSQADDQFTLFDWLAVGLAVSIIVVYSLYVYSPNLRKSVSLDRAGDNAYYLGLLFTLSSLAFSLYKLSLQEHVEATRIISLLPDFGVALFSTIVGIAARIALQQFGDDNYAEAIARDELGVAVSKFRQNLISANHSMRKLNSAVHGSAAHVLEQMDVVRSSNAQTMRAMQDHANKLSTELAKQVQGIAEISKNVLTEVKNHSHAMNSQLSSIKVDPQLQKDMGRLGGTMKQINQRYEEIFETHVKTIVAGKGVEQQLKSLGRYSEATLKNLRRTTKRSVDASAVYTDILTRATKRIQQQSRRRGQN